MNQIGGFPVIIRKRRQSSGVSSLEAKMALHLRLNRVPFVAEYVFCDGRNWRFDFAIPSKKIAIECQGGIFNGGRHTRGAALLKEYEKLNTAAAMGWQVFYAGPGRGVSGTGAVAKQVAALV